MSRDRVGSPERSAEGTLTERSLLAARQATERLALTIVAHPDLDRIGDMAVPEELAAEGELELSRQGPLFGPPRRCARKALAHRALSRAPVIIALAGDGSVEIDPTGTRRSVYVDGERIEARHAFSPSRVEAGIALLLSKRILLFLHRVAPTALMSEDDFGLVGESPSILEARNAIVTASETSDPVLVRGATGTGKELVAQAIHRHSRRPGEMVTLNIAALPEEVAAAELFGKEPGAFTSARRRQRGRMRQADGGTLFLDEVGDTPLAVQTLLLRALETRRVTPLGSDREEPVDFRLVAATDRDLERAMDEGRFRAPLFHRLQSHLVYLAPLGERREDLGRLLVALLRQALARLGMPPPEREAGTDWLPAELIDRLMRVEWGGNVRQLRAVAEQIAAEVKQAGGRPEAVRVFQGITAYLARQAPRETADTAPDLPMHAAELLRRGSAGRRGKQAAELSADDIRDALAEHGTAVAASRALGVSRAAWYRRIAALGLSTTETLADDDVLRAYEEHDGDLGRMAVSLGVAKHGLFKRLKTLGAR